MNVRLTLVTTAAAVLTVASIAVAQVPTPRVPVASVAAVAPVASVSPVAVPEAPQVPSAQSPKIVATTPQPRLKVVRPVTGGTPKVTLTTAGEDPQTPPPPPAAPVPPQAPTVFGGVRGGARAPEGFMPSQAPRRAARQLVNLRLEFTITDQVGTAAPVKKTVIMSVADGESGRIRTNAEMYRKAGNSGSFTNVPLSIDATPEVEGVKIRLKASLEYQLLNDAASADGPFGKTSITQAVTSVLNDGVPAMLCQSADPLTDRKVTLEVKATIVK